MEDLNRDRPKEGEMTAEIEELQRMRAEANRAERELAKLQGEVVPTAALEYLVKDPDRPPPTDQELEALSPICPITADPILSGRQIRENLEKLRVAVAQAFRERLRPISEREWPEIEGSDG
jgi:hypothetical protein